MASGKMIPNQKRFKPLKKQTNIIGGVAANE
jgi:hypothetical protein